MAFVRRGAILALATISVLVIAILVNANADTVSRFAANKGTNSWKDPLFATGVSNSKCATTTGKNIVGFWKEFRIESATSTNSPFTSIIPPTARIDGIQVVIDADQSSAGGQWFVQIGESETDLSSPPKTFTPFVSTSCGSAKDHILGGSSDLWGKSWVASDFGPNFTVKITTGTSTNSKKVDSIKVGVYYTPDQTPPNATVSGFPVPTFGQNGWFNAQDLTDGPPVTGTVTAVDAISNVTNISCTDNGSPLSVTPVGVWGDSTSESGSINVSSEGVHNIICVATDVIGNTGDEDNAGNEATIMIDITPPTITGSRSPVANPNGWNGASGPFAAPVIVSYGCNDTLSGLDLTLTSCGNDEVSGEGAGQSATGTAVDMAGNSASFTISDINIDLTPPTIFDPLAINPTEPTPAGSDVFYTLEQTPFVDNFDTVITVQCLPVQVPANSPTTGACSGTDDAGNTGVSNAYEVVAFHVGNGVVSSSAPGIYFAELGGDNSDWAPCNPAAGEPCGGIVISQLGGSTLIDVTVGSARMIFDDTQLDPSNVVAFVDPSTGTVLYYEEWILLNNGVPIDKVPPSSLDATCDGGDLPTDGTRQGCASAEVTLTWLLVGGPLTLQYIFVEGQPLKVLVTSAVASQTAIQRWDPVLADKLSLEGTPLGDPREVTLIGSGVAKGLGWKNDARLADNLPIMLGTFVVQDVPTAQAIFDAAPADDANGYNALAGHLLATKLNEKINTPNGCVVVAINDADNLLANAPNTSGGVGYLGPGSLLAPPPVLKPTVIAVKNQLSGFNTSGCPASYTLAKEDISPNEDANNNGILDPGEDANFNGILDPSLTSQGIYPVLKFIDIDVLIDGRSLEKAFDQFVSVTITTSGTSVTVEYNYMFNGFLDDPHVAVNLTTGSDGHVVSGACAANSDTCTASGASKSTTDTLLRMRVPDKDTSGTIIRAFFQWSGSTIKSHITSGYKIDCVSASITWGKNTDTTSGRSVEIKKFTGTTAPSARAYGTLFTDIKNGAALTTLSTSTTSLPTSSVCSYVEDQLNGTMSQTTPWVALGLMLTNDTGNRITVADENLYYNSIDGSPDPTLTLTYKACASGSYVNNACP